MHNWLKYCINSAEKLEAVTRIRMASVIVKGGSFISSGRNFHADDFNGRVHNPDLPEYMGIHAEVDAIRRASSDKLDGATIYIGGITPSGKIVCSKPCRFCWEELRIVNIKKIVWIDEDGEYAFTRI